MLFLELIVNIFKALELYSKECTDVYNNKSIVSKKLHANVLEKQKGKIFFDR